MTKIECECGKFRAELKAFPKSTPGRLMCYCDDCQIYLHHLGRADLLDPNGGSEIIPAYPADVEILSGKEHLKCTRISDKGIHRFSATCCNTPIANTRPNTPWLGLLHRVYKVNLEGMLGPIRGRIMGKYAKGKPPPDTPEKFNLKGAIAVMPFMLKGRFLKKSSPSPFFAADGVTPVAPTHVLTPDQRERARAAAGIR